MDCHTIACAIGFVECGCWHLATLGCQTGFINHLANTPGDNMQKTTFQNSSLFPRSFKMFECKSMQENCEKRNILQFSPDMASENWLDFPSHLIFWHDIVLKHFLEHSGIKKKYRRILYHALQARRNASFGKKYKFAVIAMGQFYEFQNMIYPWTFQDVCTTVLHF